MPNATPAGAVLVSTGVLLKQMLFMQMLLVLFAEGAAGAAARGQLSKASRLPGFGDRYASRSFPNTAAATS